MELMPFAELVFTFMLLLYNYLCHCICVTKVKTVILDAHGTRANC